jgi:hypothetical protein
MSSPSSHALILRITHPDGSMRESVLEQESIILGSGPGAGLHVPDPGVATLHLMLKIEPNRVVAIDLGSEHGTWFRSEALRRPTKLSPGDVLRIGQSVVEVLFGAETRHGISYPPNEVNALAKPTDAISRAKPTLPISRKEAAAWRLLAGPLPEAARPTAKERVLQASLLWRDTVLAVRHVPEGGELTVGGPAATFRLEDTGLASPMKLATFEREGARVTPPADAEAYALTADGRAVAHRGPFLLQLEESARVQLGELTLALRYVRPDAKVRVPWINRDDVAFALAASGVLLLALLALVWLLQQPPRGSTDQDVLRNQAQAVRLLMRATPKKKPPRTAKSDQGQSSEGERLKDEEGKVGQKDEKPLDAAASKAASPIPDKKQKDLKRVKSLGLLGALAKSGGSVFGQSGLGSGINDALGGLKGAAVGDARGAGGLGARGSGVGGGGVGLGLIGGLGTRGMGGGASGYGTVDLGGKGKDTTRIVPGKTTVVGGLDRDVIAKIIRQHQGEIKYCFEVELQKNPELSGKVGVSFIIDGSGDVTEDSISETTLNNPSTEQCMLMKIKRWKFPSPVGGGIVTVNFPWVFKPAGGAG